MAWELTCPMTPICAAHHVIVCRPVLHVIYWRMIVQVVVLCQFFWSLRVVPSLGDAAVRQLKDVNVHGLNLLELGRNRADAVGYLIASTRYKFAVYV